MAVPSQFIVGGVQLIMIGPALDDELDDELLLDEELDDELLLDDELDDELWLLEDELDDEL